MGGADEADVVDSINTFLDRFFLSRIGIEMLTSQYLALFNSKGIVDRTCDPCQVCRMAANAVAKICRSELGYHNTPAVNITFHGDDDARTLPLISSYLFYIVAELLKNSFRAIGEQH